jgi:signal transduction histidine kinase
LTIGLPPLHTIATRGINRSMLAWVFQPFQQGDPMISRKFGGTRLGLSISKCFVEMHGGCIEIEIEAGRGTTVTVALPASRVIGPEPLAA